jgi:glycosyltransferase involved in cell wall biosynthesis
MARLTIIIPCVGETEALEACLRSIAPRLPGQQVLVMQMGDWQLDPDAARGLDVCLVKRARMPASAARNLGARLATADYLLFLDSDNWLLGEPSTWEQQLAGALEQEPDVVILQRREEGRTFVPASKVTPWNFSRHCIEWNLVWSRRHFLELGGLDEGCGTGSGSMAQAGEAFDICFRHFSRRSSRTTYLPALEIAHPSLDAPGRPRRQQFEYAYGSNYVAMRQLRRAPSALALFWMLRTLGGLGADVARCARVGSLARLRLLVGARLLALWDSVTRDAPRRRDT